MSNNSIADELQNRSQKIKDNILSQNKEVAFIDESSPIIKLNKLKLYFGDEYVASNGIVIKQPVIQDFIDLGEENVYGMLMPFLSNPTSLRVQLWDVGVDWNKISDYELFSFLIKKIDPNYSKIVFGDVDFSKFVKIFLGTYDEEKSGKKKEKFTLFNSEQKIEISESHFQEISLYIRHMFDTFPKEEFVKGKSNKIDTINEEKAEMARRIKSNSTPNLLLMISFCLNHPGFKYKKNELREVGIYEFMDSVNRLQIYESTSALMKGMYSGFVDTTKLDKKEFNFMREFGNNA